ncbi:hypothetical protein ACWDBD_17350 [Streptomyces sp. NPDC001118]
MNAAAQLRRTHHAAQSVIEALAYRVLSGETVVQLEAGAVIQCSEFLRRLGLDEDTIRSLRSWFGRYAAKAWRTVTGCEPVKVWALIDGRWTHVAVYAPASPVFPAAVASYKRMAQYNLAYQLVA